YSRSDVVACSVSHEAGLRRSPSQLEQARRLHLCRATSQFYLKYPFYERKRTTCTSWSSRPARSQSIRAFLCNGFLFFRRDIDQVRRSVSGGSDSPSTSTVQRSPLSVGCPAVSVPELTISPALNGSVGNRRTMAALSSARHKAGLLKEFLPDPSSTKSSFFDLLEHDMRTLNRGSSSTSAAMPSGLTCTRSPITSAAWSPKDATKSLG